MNKNVLAFDFGASSGRAIIGTLDDSKLNLKEIHRFKNTPIQGETLSWDINTLFNEVKHSLQQASKNNTIASIGIDTWGVDFGLIDKKGDLIDLPVHYRDKRTEGMIEEVNQYLSDEKLYELTGNQIMNINTLFQLMYLKEHTDVLDQTETVLLMPDLFNYLLTGVKSTETTIASTTQLFDPHNKTWNYELMEQLNLPKELFTKVVKPGTTIGTISKELSDELEIPQIPVVSVCAHDTASAVVSVPTQEKDFLFISSGTWSLIGTELDKPMINEKSYKYNITNESGVNGTTRFLKNITGLWLIQETKRQFEKEGKDYSFSDLEALALEAEPFKCFIDPEHPSFQNPGDMPARIKEYAKETNQEVPETHGEIIRCIYESLALKYNCLFGEVSDIVGKTYKTVNIVGGGLQAQLLSQMISNVSGLKVLTGPVEATAIGNIMVQLIAMGEVKDVLEARRIVANTVEIKEYNSKEYDLWQKQFERYKNIIKSTNI